MGRAFLALKGPGNKMCLQNGLNVIGAVCVFIIGSLLTLERCQMYKLGNSEFDDGKTKHRSTERNMDTRQTTPTMDPIELDGRLRVVHEALTIHHFCSPSISFDSDRNADRRSSRKRRCLIISSPDLSGYELLALTFLFCFVLHPRRSLES